MGRLKQLLPLGEKPLILHCLDMLIAAGIEEIIVVLGPDHEKVEMAIAGYPVKVVINEMPGSDMAESIRAGFAAADVHSTGLLICLSDHPMVTADTVKALIAAHLTDPSKVIIPVYAGRTGHPSLFPAAALKEIFCKGNLREIISEDPDRVKWIDVPDEGIVIDIDTEEDYESAVRKNREVLYGKGP